MIHRFLQSRVSVDTLRLRTVPGLRNKSTSASFLEVSEEIQDAVKLKKPVVALETTIYTHGFPYPENIALSSHLESIVRTNGGVPATIGVLHGVAKVGFDPEDLIELLASAGKADTIKVSRRDLGYICGLGMSGRKLNGGTTIAGTMLLAHLAGIKVFATGGLGGVHRNGQDSMDISADLTELGRTPVALISSGCKSFLDIPRTLEYLETQGVGVGTFADGRSENVAFPAFWTRESGIPSPSVVRDEKEAAAMIFAQMSLPLSSGLFFANPIPAESSLPKGVMDDIMAAAIQEADHLGVSGSNNTPFILNRIKELTSGKTVAANRALVEANVLRGTEVAVELSKLQHRFAGILELDHAGKPQSTTNKITSFDQRSLGDARIRQTFSIQSIDRKDTIQSKSNRKAVDVVVAGSLAIDLSCDYHPQSHPRSSEAVAAPILETSNPAVISQSLGGVGHNVATALHYLGTNVRLCSTVGDDIAGKTALSILSERNMLTDGIMIESDGPRTAQFVAFNDSQKQLVMAMADMSILEDTVSDFPTRWNIHPNNNPPKWLVLDGNWDSTSLSAWVTVAKNSGIKVAYEPVSVEKSTRIFDTAMYLEHELTQKIDLATPNELELHSMHHMLRTKFQVSGRRWDTFTIITNRGIASFQADGYLSERRTRTLEALASLSNTALVDRRVVQSAIELLPFIPCILTKLGPEGVLMTEFLSADDSKLSDPAAAPYILSPSSPFDNSQNMQTAGIYIRLFPSVQQVPKDQIVSVNGVGDTFLGVIMAGLVKEQPKAVEELVEIAQEGAVMTLKSKESISTEISSLRPFL